MDKPLFGLNENPVAGVPAITHHHIHDIRAGKGALVADVKSVGCPAKSVYVAVIMLRILPLDVGQGKQVNAPPVGRHSTGLVPVRRRDKVFRLLLRVKRAQVFDDVRASQLFALQLLAKGFAIDGFEDADVVEVHSVFFLG